MQAIAGAAAHNFTETKHNDTYSTIDPTKLNLSGKHVVITGASKGIGRAISLSFAKAGASAIAIGARSDFAGLESEMVEAAQAAGHPAPQILPLKLDVTERASVEAAAEKVLTTFPGGSVDILINNAGYLEPFTPIASSNPDSWWTTWEINIKGTYLMTRSFLPLLLNGSEKTIVQLTSAGALSSAPGASAYQGTKTAIIRFNNFIMSEYADRGIIAYSVHPGGVMTDMAAKMDQDKFAHLFTDTAELAGDTIVWLTQERREWLADRYVSVKWDMEQFLARRDEVVKDDLLKIRICA